MVVWFCGYKIAKKEANKKVPGNILTLFNHYGEFIGKNVAYLGIYSD